MAATSEQTISQLPFSFMSEKTLELLEMRFTQKTTELEWMDVLNSITDFQKSNSKEEVWDMVKETAKLSTTIETFYYLMVASTPVKDRSGKSTMTIPHPPPVFKLKRDTVFPDYLGEDVKALLLRLPFKEGSDLKWKDFLTTFQMLKEDNGSTEKISFHGALDNVKTLDDLFIMLQVLLAEYGKERLRKSRSHYSSPPKPSSLSSLISSPKEDGLNKDLVFPDYYRYGTKRHIQFLFEKKGSSLKWESLLLALRDLESKTGSDDTLVAKIANDSESIEEFYRKVIAHTPLTSRTTDLSSTPFDPYFSLSTFTLNPNYPCPTSLTEETKKLLQCLYFQGVDDLSWENVLQAIENSKEDDIYFIVLLRKCLTIEEFYNWIVSHTSKIK